MKKWQGKMTAENFTAEVVLFQNEASEFERGIWYGHGVTTSLVLEGRYHKTDIGNIIIRLTGTECEGLDFDFVGSGEPILTTMKKTVLN